jgi:hypothetical protein
MIHAADAGLLDRLWTEVALGFDLGTRLGDLRALVIGFISCNELAHIWDEVRRLDPPWRWPLSDLVSDNAAGRLWGVFSDDPWMRIHIWLAREAVLTVAARPPGLGGVDPVTGAAPSLFSVGAALEVILTPRKNRGNRSITRREGPEFHATTLGQDP